MQCEFAATFIIYGLRPVAMDFNSALAASSFSSWHKDRMGTTIKSKTVGTIDYPHELIKVTVAIGAKAKSASWGASRLARVVSNSWECCVG